MAHVAPGVEVPLPHHLLDSASVDGVHDNFVDAVKGERITFDTAKKALVVESRNKETRIFLECSSAQQS